MWYVPLKPNIPFQLRSKERGKAIMEHKPRDKGDNFGPKLASTQLELVHAVFLTMA